MPDMLYHAKLFAQIVAKEVARYFTYRTRLFGGAVRAVLGLAIRWALWRALYETGNAGAATFAETMTFFIISSTLFDVFATSISDIIGPDVRSGDIAQRLSKPQSYQFTIVSLISSFKLTRMIIQGSVTLLLGALVIGISLPTSFGALCAFLLSALLGTALFILIDMCVSYSCFYLTDYWYVSWFTMALMQLFGGVWLPLWFYPDAMARISGMLPFQYVIFAPMEIYLGRMSAVPVIGTQLMWLLILLMLERLIWHRTINRLTIQGG